MAMLAMTILVHFWVLYGAIGIGHWAICIYTDPKVQPVKLHTTLQQYQIVWTAHAHGAFYVP
jgi:hypothetical protein